MPLYQKRRLGSLRALIAAAFYAALLPWPRPAAALAQDPRPSQATPSRETLLSQLTDPTLTAEQAVKLNADFGRLKPDAQDAQDPKARASAALIAAVVGQKLPGIRAALAQGDLSQARALLTRAETLTPAPEGYASILSALRGLAAGPGQPSHAPAPIRPDLALPSPAQVDGFSSGANYDNSRGARPADSPAATAAQPSASPDRGAAPLSRPSRFTSDIKLLGQTPGLDAPAPLAAGPAAAALDGRRLPGSVYAALSRLPLPDALHKAAARKDYEVTTQALREDQARAAGDLLAAITKQDGTAAAGAALQSEYQALRAESDPAARARKLRDWQGRVDAYLGASAPGALAEEARLKARMAEELTAQGQRADPKEALATLQRFYQEHPELAAFYRSRLRYRQHQRDALAEDAMPDGVEFSPSELGLEAQGKLVKGTVQGQPGFYLKSADLKETLSFESADGSLLIAYKKDAQGIPIVAERRLGPRGLVAQEAFTRGARRSEIERSYDAQGQLQEQLITEFDHGRATGSKRLRFEPATARLQEIEERDGSGTLKARTRLTSATAFETRYPDARWVTVGEVKDGQFVPTDTYLLDKNGQTTRQRVQLGQDGQPQRYELGYDAQTGRFDVAGLADAGVIKPRDVRRFEALLYPKNGPRPGADGLKRFSVMPFVIPSQGSSHPRLAFEQTAGSGAKVQVTSGYVAGQVVADVTSWVTTLPNGETFEKVQKAWGWDEKAKSPTMVEEYQTAFVARYDAMKDWHTEKDTSYAKKVWDGGRWVVKESQRPEDDSVWTVAKNNVNWSFENVHGFKEMSWATGKVAGVGKAVGYTLTGGSGQLIGALTGSEEHTVYGIVSKYQALGGMSGAGGAAVEELKGSLGPEKFAERRQEWIQKMREQRLAHASPTERLALESRPFDLSDDELGKALVQGTLEEGFGGAGKRFSRSAAESEGWGGRIGYGLAAVGTYTADYTFQSLGFNAIGSVTGLAGKMAGATEAGQAAAAAGTLTRAQVWINRATQASELAQGAYFKMQMAPQFLDLGEAATAGDRARVADALAQISSLALIPNGKDKSPEAAPGLNLVRLGKEIVSTSMLSEAVTGSINAALAKISKTPADEAKAAVGDGIKTDEPERSAPPQPGEPPRSALPEQIQALSRGSWPKLDRTSADLLSGLRPDQPLGVSLRTDSRGEVRRTMTVAEAVAEAAQSDVSSLRVESIPAAPRAPVKASVLAKFEGGWIDQAKPESDSSIQHAVVEFASGQLGRTSGSREMLLRLAADGQVKAIHQGEGPGWLGRASNVPPAERAAGYDATAALARQLPPEIRTTPEAAGLSGMPVYHGTLNSFESSVRAGPKNMGKGFGGRGLYVAVEGDRSIAEHFSSQAAEESSARLEQNAAAAAAGAGKPRAVVLDGRINPDKPLRVGRFEIVRDESQMDLSRGRLPFNWDDDPRLRTLLEREFDVLDLRGMRRNGLAIQTDRFLVFHQSAGADAIRWSAAEPAAAAARPAAAGGTLAVAPPKGVARAAKTFPSRLLDPSIYTPEIGARVRAEGLVFELGPANLDRLDGGEPGTRFNYVITQDAQGRVSMTVGKREPHNVEEVGMKHPALAADRPTLFAGELSRDPKTGRVRLDFNSGNFSGVGLDPRWKPTPENARALAAYSEAILGAPVEVYDHLDGKVVPTPRAEPAPKAGPQAVLRFSDPPRASELRDWARRQGFVREAGEGPETWLDPATGAWRLKLKQASFRDGLHEESQRPRYSARTAEGRYFDPVSGQVGTRKELGHQPLEFDSAPRP